SCSATPRCPPRKSTRGWTRNGCWTCIAALIRAHERSALPRCRQALSEPSSNSTTCNHPASPPAALALAKGLRQTLLLGKQGRGDDGGCARAARTCRARRACQTFQQEHRALDRGARAVP